MATPAKAVVQLKPLRTPNSEFYQLADTLNAEERARMAKVTTLGVLTARARRRGERFAMLTGPLK